MVREGYRAAVRRVLALAAVAVAVALVGCGGGSSSPVTAALDLESPGVQANGELKPSVRCGWGSLWIPLKWGEVPEDTKELAILLARFEHVKENGERKAVVKFADLVSKIEPTERRLVANVLPTGVSWSYFGNNCVQPRRGQRILLEVFALDNVHERQMKQPLATRLTKEALANPIPAEGPRSPGELTEDATAVGRLITTYTGPHGTTFLR